MSKKLSIILPVAGNDPVRSRNLVECYYAIQRQTYRNFETIMIEQNLGQGTCRESLQVDKYCAINDPHQRGFNLSWGRNVGAREADGDILVLMDSDFVFPNDYFEKIANMKTVFAGGAEKYLWSTRDQVAEWIKAGKELSAFDKHYIGWRALDWEKKIGYGAILILDRNWYWNVFGGSDESYFKYGWEDREFCDRALRLLGIHERDVERIDAYCVHLHHDNKDMKNLNTNENLYNRHKNINAEEHATRLIQLKVGDKSGPKVTGL